MAARVEITDHCDLCDSDQDVTAHELTVDRRSVYVDTCAKCWGDAPVEQVLAAGRSPRAEMARRRSTEAAIRKASAA